MSALADMIRTHAMEARGPDEQPFVLRGGGISRYYLDLRRLTLTAAGARVVADELWWAVRDCEVAFDAVGGPCVGADPIVGAMLYACGGYHYRLVDREHLRGFLVRPEAKDHGKSGRVIGSVRPGDRCVLIEDVVTTGGSSLDAVVALEAEVPGAKVVLAIAVVDHLHGAAELFAARGVPFRSLTTFDYHTGELSDGA